MSTESLLADAALRGWKQNVDRAGKMFGELSEEQLLKEIAPGKNQPLNGPINAPSLRRAMSSPKLSSITAAMSS